MADEVRRVEARYSVKDQGASSALKGMAGHAQRLSGFFDRSSNLVAGLGGIGAILGGFSLAHAVSEAGEYYETIERISRTTHMTSEAASGLFGAMSMVGISGTEAEQVMLRMSRKATMLEDTMAVVPGHVDRVGRAMNRLGVDVRQGPMENILRMSRSIRAGRADVTDVALAFRLQGKTVQNFVELLEQGPEGIRAMVQEVRKMGLEVTPQTLEQANRVRHATDRIRAGWNGIKLTIANELLPVAEKWLAYIQDHMTEWAAKAKQVAGWLREHADQIARIAMHIGKVLLLNRALMALTGGRGMLSLATGGARAGSRAFGGGSLGLLGGALGGVGTMSLMAVAERSLQQVAQNAGGVADRYRAVGTEINSSFSQVAATLGVANPELVNFNSLLDSLAKGLNEIGILGGKAISGLAQGASWMGSLGQEIAQRGVSLGMFGAATDRFRSRRQSVEDLRLLRDLAHAETANERFYGGYSPENVARIMGRTPGERPPAPNYDFRGSKFEITQSFDKDTDPDRIAVGLFNTIAALGERRAQAILTPIAAIR